VILPVQMIRASQLVGIFRVKWFMSQPSVVTLQKRTRGWDGSDDRVHRIYPSSPAARLHQYLPYGSKEQDSTAQLDVPSNRFRSWTDGDTVAHEHQADESTSSGRGHKYRNLRKELRRPEVREAVMAGVVVAVTIALFLGGVVVGVIAVVAVAVRREDRAYTLVGDAPNLMSQSARRLTGLGRRDLDPEFFRRSHELVH
jgi:hypothetical protein